MRSSLENKLIVLGVPKFSAEFTHGDLMGLLDKDFLDDFSSQIEKKTKEDPDNAHVFNKLSQKTIFEINEDGATAAAATQVGLCTSPGNSNQIESFIADRPFVYIISEAGSGLILFMGTYSGKVS